MIFGLGRKGKKDGQAKTGSKASEGDNDSHSQEASSPAPGAALALSWRGLLLRPKLTYAYYDPDLRAALNEAVSACA